MSPLESRLGELLIERRFITPPQLEEALRVQREAASYLPLGQILMDRGLITRRQLHLILEWTKKRPKLGGEFNPSTQHHMRSEAVWVCVGRGCRGVIGTSCGHAGGGASQ